MVQKGKRKTQAFENQALAFCLVPGAGAGFLNLSGSRVNLMECCGVDKWLQINAINLS